MRGDRQHTQPEHDTLPATAHRRNDPALTNAIVAARNAGRTQSEIADALHIHVQTVRRPLAKVGLPTRQESLTDDQLDEAHRFRSARWTLQQLGQRYHLAHATIKRLLASSPDDTV